MTKLAFGTAVAALGLAATAASAQTFYTDRPTFLADVAAGFYEEQFNNFTGFGVPLDGSQTTYDAPGANGFDWTASAAQGLWSNIGALSTNVALDPITITFTGSPVTAVGGDFANTDISGNVIGGTVTILTSTGDTFTQPSDSFIGFTSPVPIVSVTLSAEDGGNNSWIQIDNFVTGSFNVPEPTSGLALLGAAGGLLLRRRK